MIVSRYSRKARLNSVTASHGKHNQQLTYKLAPIEKKLLQFDKDQEDSWYTLTLGMVQQDRPAVFGPKDVSPVAVLSFPGSQDAAMYTRSELSNFWDSILISAASRKDLKKFSQSSLSFQTTTRTRTIVFFMLPEQISSWTT